MDASGINAAVDNAPVVVFFGMPGAFSLVVLTTLLQHNVVVRAVVVPGASSDADRPAMRAEAPEPIARSSLPLLTRYREPSVVTLAWDRNIPVWSLARERDPLALAALAAMGADAFCVACWPRRLPQALLALAPHGALNVHPSLLPRHRGPVPLFWTLRQGDTQAGVSIHLLDETLDGGPLLAQQPVPIPSGIAGDELERRCAAAGGQLVAGCLPALVTGGAHPRAQNAELASYEGMPKADDFVVTPDSPAAWAFTFIRAAAYWGGPIVIRAEGTSYPVAAALDYTDDSPPADESIQFQGDELWLGCTPGTLHVRLA